MRRLVADYLEPRLCPDAVMIALMVGEHDQRMPDHGSRWIFESTGYHLQFTLDNPSLRNYGEERHRGFTREQFAAIAAFADYYRCDAEDRAHWHELARGAAWLTSPG